MCGQLTDGELLGRRDDTFERLLQLSLGVGGESDSDEEEGY